MFGKHRNIPLLACLEIEKLKNGGRGEFPVTHMVEAAVSVSPVTPETICDAAVHEFRCSAFLRDTPDTAPKVIHVPVSLFDGRIAAVGREDLFGSAFEFSLADLRDSVALRNVVDPPAVA